MAKKMELVATYRRELADAEVRMASVCRSEDDALHSTKAHADWRKSRDDATVEVDRLRRLVEKAEDAIAQEAERDKTAAFQKRVAAASANNTILTKRIQDDLRQVHEILSALLIDVARATLEVEAINRELPDEEKLPSPDIIARSRPAVARQDLSAQTVELWASKDGHLAAHQEKVVDQGGGRGVLETRYSVKHFWRRNFRIVRFHPAQRAEHALPLLKSLRIPFPDQPGFAYDGSLVMTPADALAMFSAPLPCADPERETLEELVPVDDFNLATQPAPVHRRTKTSAEK